MAELIQLMADLEEEKLLTAVKGKLAEKENPLAILEQCREGMTIIGKRFEKGEYFLSELIMAGEMFKQVSTLVAPHLSGDQALIPKGKVIIGTVKGDIHDIGKNIVVSTLRGANYAVEDLGVDVPAERFVETVRETGATIVGLSCLLTTAFDPMKEAVAALKATGLPVKVMIGGGPVDDQVRSMVGADALGADAQAAVTLADGWINSMKEGQ